MKINVSFSGGLTSGFMSHVIKERFSNSAEIVYTFANTGQENEKTLEFVNECDKRWNLGVVWVEPVFNHKHMKGTISRVVDFKSACRDDSLFDEMCSIYGLPNMDYPHCTRELKLQPMNHYIKTIWAKEKYSVCIGIRADEYRRVSANPKNIIYPLVDIFITKDDVQAFWDKQPFNLGLKDFEGNCKWCWKKSDKKLKGVYEKDKSAFDVPLMLESKHSKSGVVYDDKPERKLFRGERSTIDLIESFSSKSPQLMLDLGCSESCEMYDIK